MDKENFTDYYNDPDYNYYFFMYNLTDDPNEITNLLDKGYPERQTVDVIAKASLLNDNMNKLMDSYKIVYYDFIIPDTIFNALAIQLFLYNNIIDKSNVNDYVSCFNLNRTDGDLITQPYYNEVINILSKIQ